MAEYRIHVAWNRDGAVFSDNRYSRGHRWSFDGGVVVPASSSPHIVRPPLSVAEAVDPEEALVASLSSCHMLGFLSIAAGHGFVVDTYDDRAVGVMSRDESGKLAMTRVTLFPETAFSGTPPSKEDLIAMHEEAHEQCIIARSVKTNVAVEPVMDATRQREASE